jgi:hypothetical protein
MEEEEREMTTTKRSKRMNETGAAREKEARKNATRNGKEKGEPSIGKKKKKRTRRIVTKRE